MEVTPNRLDVDDRTVFLSKNPDKRVWLATVFFGAYSWETYYALDPYCLEDLQGERYNDGIALALAHVIHRREDS